MKVTISDAFQRFLQEAGIPLMELLERAGVAVPPWREEIELSDQEYFRFLDALDGQVTDDQILPLSDIQNIKTFLPPFYAALCASHGLEALQRFASYKRLFGPVSFLIEESQSEVAVRLEVAPPREAAPRFLLLNEQLLLLSLVRTGTGIRILPARVEGPFSYGPALREVLGVPPRKSARNALVFRTVDLARPFITKNNVMLEYLEPELQRRLDELALDRTFLSQLHRALFSAIPLAQHSLAAVASRLGISPRTLQRKLLEEGTTFHTEVQTVQLQLAETYVRDGSLPIEDVTALLGYQNSVSFLRAFKQWTGMTIGEYRSRTIA